MKSVLMNVYKENVYEKCYTGPKISDQQNNLIIVFINEWEKPLERKVNHNRNHIKGPFIYFKCSFKLLF